MKLTTIETYLLNPLIFLQNPTVLSDTVWELLTQSISNSWLLQSIAYYICVTFTKK